ncbi:GGDEF domain-containing protein [Ruminococcus flavefaciens]|uniref:substrate-binding and GGDEF domain-containing protein n=1 Tax=Ruminococcus flavefaciens TaxID=1265 RepID=UPI0013DB8B16|nr:GGDEF domain-containing protein [Ruminococcus flavefaciens]
MKKKKTIAVIAADVFNDYMNRIFVGISEQCKELGYDVLTFLMAFNLDSGNLIQQGEENIFTLVKKNIIDGVVLMAGNLASQNLIDKFVKVFSHWGIPVVALDHDFDFCDSIYADDTKLFEQMTDHFIEVHGCSRIMCLTGPEGSKPAETRLAGYKNSMEKHGLEIGEGDIVYGDFWKIVSQRLAKEFIEGKREMPEAVICANDTMARYLASALVKGGKNIPEDIRISGYDGSNDAILNIPSISTVLPENERMGARAVCILHKKISGITVEPVETLAHGRLLFARSCGCGSATYHSVSTREEYHNRVVRYENYFKKSGMLESLMEEENLDGLLHKLNGFVYAINGLDTYMLCLNKNWDNIEGDEGDYVREGYAALMEARMVYTRKKTEFTSRSFRSNDILPHFIDEYCSEPSTYFLLPVHFMDRCFGYSVFRFSDIRCAASNVFALWNRNISVALEFLRVRTKLLSINQRIFMSSIRDTLTGIYNRHGFNRMAEGIFRKACQEKKQLFIIIADLDRLKMINDNYGHIEGDTAITAVANALNTSCEMNEVCARTGGDEFAIIGCGNYSPDKIQEHYRYIYDYLTRYNASAKKGYAVGVSLGCFCEVPDENEPLDKYIKIADTRMYENKVKRKKLRED